MDSELEWRFRELLLTERCTGSADLVCVRGLLPIWLFPPLLDLVIVFLAGVGLGVSFRAGLEDCEEVAIAATAAATAEGLLSLVLEGTLAEEENELEALIVSLVTSTLGGSILSR